MTAQSTFLFYLISGQAVLLGLWALLRPRRGAPSRTEQVIFALYILLGQAALLLGWRGLAAAWSAIDPIALADVVVTIHFGFVVAVLLTLLLIVVGWPLGWNWSRNFWFRLAQLIAIQVVAGQAVVGIECPLTSVERELRGGKEQLDNMEGASAVGRFCNGALFFHEPSPAVELTLHIAYVVTVVLVLLTWIVAPPRLPWRADSLDDGVKDPLKLPLTPAECVQEDGVELAHRSLQHDAHRGGV